MNELGNWIDFRNCIATMYDSGITEIEIGKKFQDKKVRWNGVVKRNNLDQEFAKSVSVKMADDLLPLGDGKLLRANHLSLNIESLEGDEWRDCCVGNHIVFEAVINSGAGPFNVIDLVSVENDPEVMLMVKLSSCKLIECSP